MNNSKSYRTWIQSDDNNSHGGITVYTVACNLSEGIQADVFSFEHDAYLYLVDQAEGLTDAQRIELVAARRVAGPRAVLGPLQCVRLAGHQLSD